MSVNIFEALQNAEINLKGSLDVQRQIGMRQLHNALVLIEKGYELGDDIDALLATYGDVEDVPEKNND